jgi:hypothetical protein
MGSHGEMLDVFFPIWNHNLVHELCPGEFLSIYDSLGTYLGRLPLDIR